MTSSCISPSCGRDVGSKGDPHHPQSCGRTTCDAYAEGFDAGQIAEAKRSSRKPSSPDQREWTLCEVHRDVLITHGTCKHCNGDRNLLQVVPRATRDALNEELIEARAEASMWHIKYDASEEKRAAWKAKTRESVRDFLTEHPDLRIRQLSDMTGVLEAQLDLANTKLLRAVEALKWYADPENNGRQTFRNGEQSEATSSWPVYRPIDDDEGDVAHGALEAIGEIK